MYGCTIASALSATKSSSLLPSCSLFPKHAQQHSCKIHSQALTPHLDMRHHSQMTSIASPLQRAPERACLTFPSCMQTKGQHIRTTFLPQSYHNQVFFYCSHTPTSGRKVTMRRVHAEDNLVLSLGLSTVFTTRERTLLQQHKNKGNKRI